MAEQQFGGAKALATIDQAAKFLAEGWPPALRTFCNACHERGFSLEESFELTKMFFKQLLEGKRA